VLVVSQRALSTTTAEVRAVGDVDLATASELRSAVLAAVKLDGVTQIEVNLGEVDFLDSTGLSALVSGRNAATAAGKQFYITRCAPRVRMVLGLTGLDKVMLRGIDEY
jgi:anti-sigma B factor antagonist